MEVQAGHRPSLRVRPSLWGGSGCPELPRPVGRVSPDSLLYLSKRTPASLASAAICRQAARTEAPQRFFLHLRAFSAKFARFRVLAERDFFILRSFETGIFLPFFAPADLRRRPRLDFLILMGLRLAATLLPLAPAGKSGLARARSLASSLSCLALSGQGGTAPS